MNRLQVLPRRAAMRNPKVLAVKSRIELTGDEALDHTPTREAILELKTHDGRTLRSHTRAVRGTPPKPMNREEVAAKSYDLMAPLLGKARAHALIDAVWNIKKLRSLRNLRPLLRG